MVATAIAERGHAVCEAGTGTGKTLAYLVPAVLAGRRTLVSTATKTLQDQLYQQDLPLVLEALGSALTPALLKGRANYLCLHRLAQAEGEPTLWPEDRVLLAQVTGWARATTIGDRAELSAVPEEAALWPLVTSTVDNCLGQSCPQFEPCFVVKARRAAAAADIVVVNHHLLFADMALREEGFGELLPTAQVVIVDEAHQLPELAAQAFGHTVSSRQVRELGRDSDRAALSEAPDMPALRETARALEAALIWTQHELGRYQGRIDRDTLLHDQPARDSFEKIRAALVLLESALEVAAERGVELMRCFERCVLLRARLGAFEAEDDDHVHWVEVSHRGFVVHSTPLVVADQFHARLEQSAAAWVFCSATLAVDGDFSHFRRELGVHHAQAVAWPSPFDFAQQALLYLPPMTATPNSSEYLSAVADVALKVINLSRGRTFLLCTSYRALNHYAGPLRAALNYPVLVQGEAPRATLLAEFKRLGNAVLIGTATFWEGVDVRGDALSCVIIDKLPFATPDDPVLRARVKRLEAAGQNAFTAYQIPVAAISLKQGAGRLIRDVQDRGVLVLCDPRLRSRGYGKTFLRALPPAPVTTDLAAVEAFFKIDAEIDGRAG